MTIGDFVMVNAYLLQLYSPLNMLGWVYRVLRQSFTDIEQMYALLAERSEIEDKPGAPALKPGPGRVAFHNVSFAYDERRPILNDVSFEIPAGKTVAVVGPTGGGKTTVARLLFRFYDPQSGSITIDGQDLRDVTQDSLRNVIGVVPQDTVLFNDSIRYNIAYGDVSAEPAQIEDAARRAQLSDFIAKLPDGYLTRVGERGLKLSGGEKQRVAIARVLMKNPEILIFDEATSSLELAHRARDPGESAPDLGPPHDARDRAPALDRGRCRRDPRAGRRRDCRARHASDAARARRNLRGDVGAPAARDRRARRGGGVASPRAAGA